AFVSGFPLSRRFGLARGFEVYDDEFDEERGAKETTDRAIAYLREQTAPRFFVWVHYFDPHFPYEGGYANEVSTMDEQLGRLIEAFEQRAGGQGAIIVVADHGEGLGEHGEAQHGNLLYQGVMHVPLVIAGRAVERGVVDTPVSTRHVFHTIAAWAGIGAEASLASGTPPNEVVAGEAMIPFLQYGWQPQVMAVEGRRKAIHAGTTEVYDVLSDPKETRDLGSNDLSREIRKVLLEYPVPSLNATPSASTLSEEEQKKLASLGYITADARPVIRKDAPRPRDMAPLFETLDQASGYFVQEQYARAIPLLEKVLAADPHNLMAALRVAAAHSALGHNAQALAAFEKAQAIAPQSPDVRHYLALHYARTGDLERAEPMLERVVAETPDRLPAVEALATIREQQRRYEDALALRQKAVTLKGVTAPDLIRIGQLAMELGRTDVAISALEQARTIQGSLFRNDLELGVLYMAARRFEDARTAIDRVPQSHPAYAMALFKRAQLSVLLSEPDRNARIEAAKKHADATTRELIAREKLFQ
ncbi:MAG: tetratricopeptide repeat protein, partial [Thermoanaerobaculia bacterium]